MPVYMNSGKIVAGRDGWRIEGSTRGPRGPKNPFTDQRRSLMPVQRHQLVPSNGLKTQPDTPTRPTSSSNIRPAVLWASLGFAHSLYALY